jgi:hypothetical protein
MLSPQWGRPNFAPFDIRPNLALTGVNLLHRFPAAPLVNRDGPMDPASVEGVCHWSMAPRHV